MKTVQKNDHYSIPPLDTRWFERFTKASAFNFLELLDGHKEERLQEKELFLNQKKRNPSFTYPFINREIIFFHRGLLTRLFAEIATNEKSALVREVYAGRIQSELWQLDMLEATLQKKDVNFYSLSKKLYGSPEPAVFFSLIKDLKEFYEGLVNTEGVKSTATQLLTLCPTTDRDFLPIAPPTPSEFNSLQKILRPVFEDLLSLVGTSDLARIHKAKDVQKIFTRALEQRGLFEWKVTLSKTSKAAINVQNDQKQILIPETREMSGQVLQELLSHEIGCHVMRHVHGKDSGLLLLSSGLQKYERSEEGFATLAQQILAPSFSGYSGLERHLSISLAAGVDGKKRDFREVFTFLYLHFFLDQKLKNPLQSEELSQKKANDNAWNATTRTFRGTTTRTPGACFTKDIIYREGNIRSWEALAKNPSLVDNFFFGKMDPTLSEHQQILQKLKKNKA
jgi:hypothetical protein